MIVSIDIPVQGIFTIPSCPQVLEVAKHDVGGPTARPKPCLLGRSDGQGVKAEQLVQIMPTLPASHGWDVRTHLQC